jgi:hypothetical protein
MTMDINKWKSVAVKIDDYKLLKGMCKEKFRAPAGMISKLVHDYCKFVAKKEGTTVEAIKKKYINGYKG